MSTVAMSIGDRLNQLNQNFLGHLDTLSDCKEFRINPQGYFSVNLERITPILKEEIDFKNEFLSEKILKNLEDLFTQLTKKIKKLNELSSPFRSKILNVEKLKYSINKIILLWETIYRRYRDFQDFRNATSLCQEIKLNNAFLKILDLSKLTFLGFYIKSVFENLQSNKTIQILKVEAVSTTISCYDGIFKKLIENNSSLKEIYSSGVFYDEFGHSLKWNSSLEVLHLTNAFIELYDLIGIFESLKINKSINSIILEAIKLPNFYWRNPRIIPYKVEVPFFESGYFVDKKKNRQFDFQESELLNKNRTLRKFEIRDLSFIRAVKSKANSYGWVNKIVKTARFLGYSSGYNTDAMMVGESCEETEMGVKKALGKIIETLQTKDQIVKKNCELSNCAFESIRINNIAKLNELLQVENFSPNIRKPSKKISLLQYAVFLGSIEAISLLIKHPDIDVQMEDKLGLTALDLAIEARNEEIVHLLKTHLLNKKSTRRFKLDFKEIGKSLEEIEKMFGDKFNWEEFRKLSSKKIIQKYLEQKKDIFNEDSLEILQELIKLDPKSAQEAIEIIQKAETKFIEETNKNATLLSTPNTKPENEIQIKNSPEVEKKQSPQCEDENKLPQKIDEVEKNSEEVPHKHGEIEVRFTEVEEEVEKNTADIEELNLALLSVEKRLKIIEEKQEFKKAKKEYLEKLLQSPQLADFYEILFIKLKSLLISAKAITGPLAKASEGNIGEVAANFESLANVIGAIPGFGEVPEKVLNIAAQPLSSIDEKRQKNSGMSIAKLEYNLGKKKIVDETARLLTECLAESLKKLPPQSDKKNSIREKAAKKILKSQTFSEAEKFADYVSMIIFDTLLKNGFDRNKGSFSSQMITAVLKKRPVKSDKMKKTLSWAFRNSVVKVQKGNKIQPCTIRDVLGKTGIWTEKGDLYYRKKGEGNSEIIFGDHETFGTCLVTDKIAQELMNMKRIKFISSTGKKQNRLLSEEWKTIQT